MPISTCSQPAPSRSEPTSGAVRARWHQRRSVTIAAGLAVLAAAVVLLLVSLRSSDRGALHPAQAVILGAIEGITEFLPVSSTGHLVVAQRLLGLGDTAPERDALDSYAVIIQGGAILAVAWLFWGRLVGVTAALARMLPLPGVCRDVAPADRRLAMALIVAVAPAGLIGFIGGDAVQRHLFSPGPIALAWVVGGAVLLGLAGWLHHRGVGGDAVGFGLDQVTAQHAFVIGLAQALALWPGVSRSLVTIVAGCLVGLTLPAAVELSFLLGFVVLVAASGLEIVTHGGDIIAAYGWAGPLLGLVVAFISAVAAIRWLLRVISGRSLAGFGWYRLAAAAVTFSLLGAGRL